MQNMKSYLKGVISCVNAEGKCTRDCPEKIGVVVK